MSHIRIEDLFGSKKGPPPIMQALSVGFGKETFKSDSVSLAAFHVSEGFVRETMGKAFQRQGHLQKFPASSFPEINGYLFLDTLRVPDGQIILLQCSVRHLASPIRDGAIFLRTRATGPMLTIKANLPPAQEASQTGDFLVFQGRADILDPDELSAYGSEIPQRFRDGFMAADEVAECFTVTELAPETERKPLYETAQDSEGNEVVLQKRPGRRIRLRPAK
jgi:hypothetical protein